MKSPEETDRFRTKMIEHLEAALALTDETGDGAAGYMIEAAPRCLLSPRYAERAALFGVGICRDANGRQERRTSITAGVFRHHVANAFPVFRLPC
jgi:hypothetical protein